MTLFGIPQIHVEDVVSMVHVCTLPQFAKYEMIHRETSLKNLKCANHVANLKKKKHIDYM